MHRLTATDTPMVRYTRTIFPSYAGDSDNDIELLQHVDIGICMGNGTEKCKAVCDEITDDVEHDGLYKSFVKHNLIESR